MPATETQIPNITKKKRFDRQKFLALNEVCTFDEYLEKARVNPKMFRTSFQMTLDMILARGSHTFEKYKKTLTHYNFFDECSPPICGLEETKDKIVEFIKGAAGHYGTEKRFLLLHGPVGSSKSTIFKAIKVGMEKYSQLDEGAWYTHKWVDMPVEDGIAISKEDECPMHEQPLKLIPEEYRQAFLEEYNQLHQEQASEESRDSLYDLRCTGDLCPRCKKYMNLLLVKYDGDWDKVVEKHIRIIRKTHCEADRCGIATFQPKDEKNQDSTELTGDINYRTIAQFGSDSDARAFTFDGELNIANRGIAEFIEVLKLDVAFLYDLLGATQEKQIKPKKFPQISVDIFIGGHTNNPEYKKLQNNEFMEALKDRTVKIDVPYLVKHSDELKVLLETYKGLRTHVPPHTYEIAAFWAVLTRLHDDPDGKLTLIQKAELYDGKMIPGYNEDAVYEMMLKCKGEGMYSGVSCRFVQDKISNCLSQHPEGINAFMVLNEFKDGLEHSTLISDKEKVSRYLTCIELAIKKLEKILTNEVQKAMVGDEDAVIRLCQQYIDNVMVFNKKGKIKNPLTGQMEIPNERLMRDIERRMEIPETGAPDYRREIAAFIGDMAMSKQTFRWDSNLELKEALEAKLFDDIKDTIKLSAMSDGAKVVDPEQQEKLDALKARMIKWYGYNDRSATDVLTHVGSIFARGGDKDEKN